MEEHALHVSSIPLVWLSSFGIALLAVWLVGYVFYQRRIATLSKVPGPFWASLSPAWKLLEVNKGTFCEKIPDLHRKYGAIVRIAPSEAIISNGSAIREIYSNTSGRDFLKVSKARYDLVVFALTPHPDGLL